MELRVGLLYCCTAVQLCAGQSVLGTSWRHRSQIGTVSKGKAAVAPLFVITSESGFRRKHIACYPYNQQEAFPPKRSKQSLGRQICQRRDMFKTLPHLSYRKLHAHILHLSFSALTIKDGIDVPRAVAVNMIALARTAYVATVLLYSIPGTK